MNCPVLRELALQEACAENEQSRVMTGGDYDIAAIRDCGERCTCGGIIYAQRLQIQALERELDKLRAQAGVAAAHPDRMSALVSGPDAAKGEK